MNNVITTIALFLFASLACVAQETVSLKVTIPNATSDTGKMMIGVYQKDTFMKGAPLQGTSVVIVDGVATAIFENLPAGEYAVSVLHDKNENGRMDYENGRPGEPYGLSNNPMSYGPPQWDEAKFMLKEHAEIIVRL